MLIITREKSWSVLLEEGHVLSDQVRARFCGNCKSRSEVLATNFGNPNLLLFGCKDSKCRHRFLRLDFEDALPARSASS